MSIFRLVSDEVGWRVERLLERLHGRQMVHLLHIGKTGGSAVKSALRQHRRSQPYVLALHPHYVRLWHIPKGDPFFFFLRDPVQRFVSGFYSRQRQGRPRYDYPWSPGEQAAFAAFQTPSELGAALGTPDERQRERAVAAMQAIVHVNDSFWNWFHDEAYFHRRASDLFFIGYQESLSSDFSTLVAKLGLPDDLALPADMVQANRPADPVDRTLSAEAAANLRDWYARDYEFLDMCRRYETAAADAGSVGDTPALAASSASSHE